MTINNKFVAESENITPGELIDLWQNIDMFCHFFYKNFGGEDF